MPTLAKLTAVPLPKRRLDGNSLLPAIKSPEGESPHDVFHWQSGRGLGGKPQWAVRAGSWKLIGNPKDTSNKAPLTAADKFFLVNLDQDPAEMANVARQHPEITQRLKELHEKWLQEVTQQ